MQYPSFLSYIVMVLLFSQAILRSDRRVWGGSSRDFAPMACFFYLAINDRAESCPIDLQCSFCVSIGARIRSMPDLTTWNCFAMARDEGSLLRGILD